ncbi:ZIP zinc transporter-domain-containing protein [Mariannaea sp. PMI_226]|nr:ZIP zinc transporter-domain-containing protein [Mariannaea sp. PMI_226]
MSRPSIVGGGALGHSTRNATSSPPVTLLVASQEPKGISNPHNQINASRDAAGKENSTELVVNNNGKNHLGHLGFLTDKLDRRSSSTGMGRSSRCLGLPSCLKIADDGDDHVRPCPGPMKSYISHAWSWTTWLLSVLTVSWILSFWNSSSNTPSTSAPSQEPLLPSRVSLLQKRSSCASNSVDKNAYNMPLHVGAVFIIFFVSTLACSFPIMASKIPGLRIPTRFFFTVRHFGTGVLIATAFVHLLPTAFISLGDPCLDSFWTTRYPAMPGAISLAAIFFVIIIEMVFHPSRRIQPAESTRCCGSQETSNNQNQNHGDCTRSMVMLPVREIGPLRGRASSISHGLTTLNSQGDAEHTNIDISRGENNQRRTKQSSEGSSLEDSQLPALTPEQKKRKELLQCVLLELGILFHSIFIGMSLSVSVGNEFIVLLIAIIFHQTFEGLALGTRISAVKWPQGKLQPWFMALAYGCTTPLGQAIGLATHTLYSPGSEVGLIVVGVMNAISAGLLTFASLVELLSEDFLSDESWRVLRGKKRVCACLLVFFGAFLMSLVGAWA